MLHDKVNGVATLATGKALANVARRGYRERGRAVIVEWAQTHIIHPTFAQSDEIGHHIHDLGGIDNPIYGSLVNHIKCENTNKLANTQVKSQIKTSAII